MLIALPLLLSAAAAFASDARRTRALGGPDVLDPDLPEIDIRPRKKIEPPKMYRVVLYNDPEIWAMIVKEALQEFFGLSSSQAMRVMLSAHRDGAATVGVYSYEEAQTRVHQAEAWTGERMEAEFNIRRSATFDILEEDRFGAHHHSAGAIRA